MRADQMESLYDTENDAMDQLLKDTEEERQVQKRVFSSFNMSHGRSENNLNLTFFYTNVFWGLKILHSKADKQQGRSKLYGQW